MMQKKHRTTIFVILAVLILAGIATYFIVSRSAEPAAMAPAVQALSSSEGVGRYQDIDGNPVSLDDYLGRVLVVSSWASWCPQCRSTLPILAEVGTNYPEDEVVVLAINRAEPITTAQAYLRSIDSSEGMELILDPADRYYDSIGGYAMPETLVYDQDGDVVAQLRGSVSPDTLGAYVLQALDRDN